MKQKILLFLIGGGNECSCLFAFTKHLYKEQF